MSNRFLQIITLTICISAPSCQKSSNSSTDPTTVEIEIISPASGAVFHSGDSILLEGTVSSEAEMHGYELKISDTSTGSIWFDYSQHVHNDHYTFSKKYELTGSDSQTLQVQVIAALDHNGHSAAKTIAIYYRP